MKRSISMPIVIYGKIFVKQAVENRTNTIDFANAM